MASSAAGTAAASTGTDASALAVAMHRATTASAAVGADGSAPTVGMLARVETAIVDTKVAITSAAACTDAARPGVASGSFATMQALRVVLQEGESHAMEEVRLDLERARMTAEDLRGAAFLPRITNYDAMRTLQKLGAVSDAVVYAKLAVYDIAETHRQMRNSRMSP